MPAIARHGDSCGGSIVATAATVRVDGLPVARVGDAITPHGDPPHHAAVLESGSPTVLVEGRAVVRVGDRASCGHLVSSGSPATVIDGGS